METKGSLFWFGTWVYSGGQRFVKSFRGIRERLYCSFSMLGNTCWCTGPLRHESILINGFWDLGL